MYIEIKKNVGYEKAIQFSCKALTDHYKTDVCLKMLIKDINNYINNYIADIIKKALPRFQGPYLPVFIDPMLMSIVNTLLPDCLMDMRACKKDVNYVMEWASDIEQLITYFLQHISELETIVLPN